MNKKDEIQDIASKVIDAETDSILFISIRLGKTRIALKAIKKDESVLVVYPNIPIKKSWTDEIIKYRPLSENITYTVKNSLKKFKDKEFDFVVVDEPQLLSINQLNLLKTIKYKRRVLLTGTLKPSTIIRLQTILGAEVKYTYGIAEAIRDKLVKDYKIFVHLTDLDDSNISILYKKYGRDAVGSERTVYNSYSETMAYFENQFAMTHDLKSKLGYKKYMGLRTNFLYNSKTLLDFATGIVNQYKNEKVLIYALRQDVADQLSDKSYHSKNKDVAALDHFKISTKGHLSVVNCVQAGVTINNLNRVIFHTCESNTEVFYQKLGRSLLYEFEGEIANVHICALRNTQMEIWVDNACKSLEQDKIVYVYKGVEYAKIDWIKYNFPGKELFMYNGSICVLLDDEQRQFSKYKFIGNNNTEYTLSKDRVVKI